MHFLAPGHLKHRLAQPHVNSQQSRRGGMGEWSMAVVLKTDPGDLLTSRSSA
jgi:hypothetical protein